MRPTKIKVLALTAAVTVMFTGCMTENANVKINSDGTASAVATVDIDKASMDTWLTSSGLTTSDISDGKEMKVVTKDGKEFYEATETYSSTVDKIGEVVKEALSSDAYVTSTTLYSEVSLAQSESVAMYSAMGIDTSAITLNFSIEFPAAITSTTGTIDPANPNKANFVINLATTNMIVFATTDSTVTSDAVKATVQKLNQVGKVKVKSLKANKVKGKKATATLKFKKAAQAKNYQIQWSTNKNFKKKTSATAKKVRYTIKNLKKGTKYFVRVRAAKTNYCGTEVYGDWSVKTVKTKK
ncbi:fibronectin type III domain-containing protein [uncultured Eubacterium sp.]|uniref:fibronectin type III domain-containing protein n=1 Tax=uncultured Eubacterium sp. TaxID=165185 RepID=UPI003266BFB3